MSATAQGAAEASPLASAGRGSVGAKSPAVASPVSLPDGSLPVPGERWRGKYDVVELLGTSEAGSLWSGRTVEGGKDVQIRAFKPAQPEVRAQVWAKVGGIDSPHLQHARDAQKAGEWRVEVADAPKGIPLNAWRAQRASVDPDTIKAIVAQVAEAVAALHAFELVHLALKPEVIHLHEEGSNVTCMLAGLEALTTFDRKEPIPAAVDPFYAPPEAHGLLVHVPGPGLCAWDWWSLGRTIQETILGRHIVHHLANVPTGEGSAELRVQSESLLVEVDPKGPRAGAVEKMPRLDPATDLLLRGLLTSAMEARWTGDNVDRWVRGQQVKSHYDTPRKDTHFRWRGRPCTVPEIAATLQTAEHWPENNVQLFEPTTPGTLAHFLKWSPTQTAAQDQLVSALELGDSLPLKLSSPAARREAVTMIALLQLSGGKLMWRGRALDGEGISAMMAELGEADAIMILRGLTTRSTALQIERVDNAGGRLLTEMGRTVGDVEGVLKRYGWMNPNDPASVARLFRLALEPIPALRATRDALAQQFAGSDHPAMEKLFKAQNVGRGELVILAWAALRPVDFKFYSHAEASRRRAETLRTRGTELLQALTWVEFERALAVGRLVISGWGWFILSWFLIGSVAVVLWPGYLGAALAVVPLIVALLVRVAVSPLVRRSLRKEVPEAAWGWRDGPARCRRELRLAGRAVRQEALSEELNGIRKELSSLQNLDPKPPELPPLPRFRGVRIIGAASWVLLAVFVGVAGWRAIVHPVSMKELKAAWSPETDPAKEKAEAAAKAALAKIEEEKVETKISWPFRASEEPVKLSMRSTQAATSEQITYATQYGRRIAAPYRPETINMVIILSVPAGDAIAVMMFDGKRGEVVNQQIYLLDFRPIPRTTVELSGRKGVYLD